MRTLSAIIFFSFFIGNQSSSQSKILDDYVSFALTQNLSIRSLELGKTKQQSKIEQAQKLWNPNLNLSANYLLAEGGRTIIFPVGDLFNPTYMALNQLSGMNNFPTDLKNEEIQLTPNNFIDVQLAISKPLINSSIKYNRLIQQELLKLNDLDISIAKQDIRLQTKTAYFNHLKTIEGLKILDDSEGLLREVLAFNRKLIKYDKATLDVVADVEYQLELLNSQRAVLLEQMELSKALFNLLLNRSLTEPIVADTMLLKEDFFNTTAIQILKDQAFQSRIELRTIEVAESVNDLNQKRIDKEKWPTLGISGGIGMQTEDFDFEYENILFTLGLGLNMKILDGGLRKKKIEELQIDRQILANDRNRIHQQIEIEVTRQFYKLKSLQSKMLAEQAAASSAKKSLRVIRTKYENEKALLIELLEAEQRVTNSVLSQALTKYDYLIQLAELEKVLGI